MLFQLQRLYGKMNTIGVCARAWGVRITKELVVTEGRLNLLKRVLEIQRDMFSVKVKSVASALTWLVYGCTVLNLIESY